MSRRREKLSDAAWDLIQNDPGYLKLIGAWDDGYERYSDSNRWERLGKIDDMLRDNNFYEDGSYRTSLRNQDRDMAAYTYYDNVDYDSSYIGRGDSPGYRHDKTSIYRMPVEGNPNDRRFYSGTDHGWDTSYGTGSAAHALRKYYTNPSDSLTTAEVNEILRANLTNPDNINSAEDYGVRLLEDDYVFDKKGRLHSYNRE
tara:strand:+ start:1253 stop:1852 length:600 start_codon:yes stop_codon:yes gene_type:complete